MIKSISPAVNFNVYDKSQYVDASKNVSSYAGFVVQAKSGRPHKFYYTVSKSDYIREFGDVWLSGQYSTSMLLRYLDSYSSAIVVREVNTKTKDALYPTVFIGKYKNNAEGMSKSCKPYDKNNHTTTGGLWDLFFDYNEEDRNWGNVFADTDNNSRVRAINENFNTDYTFLVHYKNPTGEMNKKISVSIYRHFSKKLEKEDTINLVNNNEDNSRYEINLSELQVGDLIEVRALEEYYIFSYSTSTKLNTEINDTFTNVFSKLSVDKITIYFKYAGVVESSDFSVKINNVAQTMISGNELTSSIYYDKNNNILYVKKDIHLVEETTKRIFNVEDNVTISFKYEGEDIIKEYVIDSSYEFTNSWLSEYYVYILSLKYTNSEIPINEGIISNIKFERTNVPEVDLIENIENKEKFFILCVYKNGMKVSSYVLSKDRTLNLLFQSRQTLLTKAVNDADENINIIDNVNVTTLPEEIIEPIGIDGGNNGSDLEEEDYFRGLDMFSKRDDVDIFFLVPPVKDPDILDNAKFNSVMAKYCINVSKKRNNDVFVPCVTLKKKSAYEHVQYRLGKGKYSGIGLNIDTYLAGIYADWIEVYDDIRREYQVIPPLGDILVVYSDMFLNYDYWFAPAGRKRGLLPSSVVSLVNNFSNKSDRDLLYKNQINPIMMNSMYPSPVIFGQKTAQIVSSSLDRISCAFLTIVFNKVFTPQGDVVLFEKNDEETRSLFSSMITDYLEYVKIRKGIYSYRVVCDETNNTPYILNNNSFVIDIYVQFLKDIEEVMFNLYFEPTGGEVTVK